MGDERLQEAGDARRAGRALRHDTPQRGPGARRRRHHHLTAAAAAAADTAAAAVSGQGRRPVWRMAAERHRGDCCCPRGARWTTPAATAETTSQSATQSTAESAAESTTDTTSCCRIHHIVYHTAGRRVRSSAHHSASSTTYPQVHRKISHTAHFKIHHRIHFSQPRSLWHSPTSSTVARPSVRLCSPGPSAAPAR